MKDFLVESVQMSRARLWSGFSSRFWNPPVISTSTTLDSACALEKLTASAAISFACEPAITKVVMGSKLYFPAPTEAKSYKEATV